MDTAFQAVKKSGKEGPVIAFVAEYDALPKIGHACGHNLFCCSAVGAGIVLSHLQQELGGEVRVIGSPAEEGTVPNYGAKVVLVEQGYFDDVDCVFTAHGEGETVIERNLVAATTVKIRFKGYAVHAGGDPVQGRNALTAGMLCINNMNAIRQQHMPCDVVNSIVTEGGLISNTIPDHCGLEFSVRSDTSKNLDRVLQNLENSAKAAALVTGCEYETEVVKNPMRDTKSNHALGTVMAEYLDSIGAPYKAADSRNFAWDVGDITYVCPTLGSYFKIGSTDIVCHTEPFCEAAGSETGFEGMMMAAKGMAAVALEYLVNPQLRENAWKEYEETRKPFR
jgi:amidohydrolase